MTQDNVEADDCPDGPFLAGKLADWYSRRIQNQMTQSKNRGEVEGLQVTIATTTIGDEREQMGRMLPMICNHFPGPPGSADQKLRMKRYLADLEAIVGREVLPRDLAGLVQTKTIRESSRNIDLEQLTVSEVDAAEVHTPRFKDFFTRLSKANPSSVSLWLPATFACGTLILPSMQDIALDFTSLTETGGILCLITSDARDRLLLDFFSSQTGARRLVIETQGTHWTALGY